MLCSNCGYENPREHRFCGMCGTPFPYRAISVPEAQSALAFGSVPVEVSPTELVFAPHVPSVEEPTAELEPASAGPDIVPEAAEPVEEVIAQPAVEATEVAVEGGSEVPPEIPAEAAGEVAVADVAVAEVAPTEAETSVKHEPELAAVEENSTPTMAPEEEVAEPVADVQKPPAPVVVMPAPRPFLIQTERKQEPPPPPRVIHPAPDTLPYSPPPASAGMPTFQEIQEAAGAPPISPYEAPGEKPADEDEELKEFVASFHWTPPEETAGELTMRSEAPEIDEEEPAEFHHPSFDNDEPPPETEPHPTGQEHYTPSQPAPRPRFLEMSGDDDKPEAGGEVPAAVLDDPPPAAKTKWWLWTSILALVGIFGGLGFWQGRAQGLRSMQGPVDFVRDQYEHVRQWMAEKSAAPAPASTTPAESAQKDDAHKKDEPTATQNPEPAPKPDATEAAKPPELTTSTQTPAPGSANGAGAEATATESPKPIQPPPATKPTSKAQPGQQEFDKAMNASDATAAAAWLWKSTSHGNPEAPVRLADMYIRGNGVPKSCEQALVLLRSASTKENASARNRLAALYANGTCVARDRVKAYQLMSSALAADPSNAWAKENQQVLWGQMTPQERTEAQRPN